jgi:hypothetical protein
VLYVESTGGASFPPPCCCALAKRAIISLRDGHGYYGVVAKLSRS